MRDMTYRIYLSEVLYQINNNLVGYVGGNLINMKYSEIINPPKEETRTPDEIIEVIKSKLREV